jgi:hypothetical protein
MYHNLLLFEQKQFDTLKDKISMNAISLKDQLFMRLQVPPLYSLKETSIKLDK